MKQLMICATCVVLLSSSLPAWAEKSPEAQKMETDMKFDLSASAGEQASGQGGSAVRGAYGSKAARSGLTASQTSANAQTKKVPSPLECGASAQTNRKTMGKWMGWGAFAGAGAVGALAISEGTASISVLFLGCCAYFGVIGGAVAGAAGLAYLGIKSMQNPAPACR